MFAIDAPNEPVPGTTVLPTYPPQSYHPPHSYPSSYPNDPMAMPPFGGNYVQGQPAQPHFPGTVPQRPYPGHPGPAANRKKSAEQHNSGKAVGGGDRAMILLGAFLLIIGIVVNMLPLAGTQVPLFRGKGLTGPILGLLMGLGGAGLLATGLRHFKMASIISGAAGGCFILLVFLLSIVAGREKNNTLMVEAGDNTKSDEPVRITNATGPWYKAYPEWTGFRAQATSSSTSDHWTRMPLSIGGISATLPGEPDRRARQLQIGGKSVTAKVVETHDQQQTFRISTFEYPEPGKSDTEKLDSVEKALGDVSRARSSDIDSFTAREFNGQGQHGVIVVVGETIVIAHCEGEPTLVPGEISYKMIGSIMIDPSAKQDHRNEFSDALDPFALDGSAMTPSPIGPTPVDGRVAPQLALGADEKNHESLIINYMRYIENEMIERIHRRATMSFAPHYLTVSAGEDVGSRRYLANAEKDPVVGVDFVVTKSGSTFAFTSIVPVFDKTKQPCQVEAKPGYALSGIHVNAQTHVEGIKFVFSKIIEKGFDNGQSYESAWYGTPAAGIGQVLSGDGRPVYGFWMCKGQSMRSIGLIREKR